MESNQLCQPNNNRRPWRPQLHLPLHQAKSHHQRRQLNQWMGMGMNGSQRLMEQISTVQQEVVLLGLNLKIEFLLN